MTDTEITEAAAKLVGWVRSKYDSDFDPLHNIAHAGLLVEAIHKASGLTQRKFEARLNGIRLQRNYLHRYLWLTPRYLTVAAVEACKKEKG